MARKQGPKPVTPDNVYRVLSNRQHATMNAHEIAMFMGHGRDGVDAVIQALDTLETEGRIQWQS